jgi:hypothetical protein
MEETIDVVKPGDAVGIQLERLDTVQKRGIAVAVP